MKEPVSSILIHTRLVSTKSNYAFLFLSGGILNREELVTLNLTLERVTMMMIIIIIIIFKRYLLVQG